jgi:hypothetical protein
MATKIRRVSAKSKTIPANVVELGNALKFIACAQRDIGQPYQTHVRLGNKWAVAYDGILTAACPIPEELDCCPHTVRLIEALSKMTGDGLSLTLGTTGLMVKSGSLRVIVPCIINELMPVVAPDPVCGLINDELLHAFKKVMKLASDTAEHVLTASILVRSGSMLATDRHTMLEAWHGIDLPTIAIPKRSVKAVVECGKSVVKFGFSETSFTFYFQDESLIKTQLYAEKWPDSAFKILDQPLVQYKPLPAGFFDAVAAVAPHGNNSVYLSDNFVSSHAPKDGEIGARMELPGCEGDWCMSPDKLMALQGLMTDGDFGMSEPKAIFFLGDKIRGAVAARGGE